MRGRSSIFSFDTLAVRPRLSASIAWCFVMLLVVRWFTGWAAVSPTDRYDILNAAEYLRSDKVHDLKVVFFGSSRMQTAIIPQEWARKAGWKPAQVANLAVNGGRLWDAQYMLASSGGLPESVELVVIEISVWEFNRNKRNPITGSAEVPQHMRHWASLSDRLALDTSSWQRLELLGDFVWPLYLRRPLQRWEQDGQKVKADPPFSPPIHWDNKSRDALAASANFKSAHVANMHFADFEMSLFTQRSMAALVAAVRKPGRRVVLLQLPARREYVNATDVSLQLTPLFRSVRDVVLSQSSADVTPLIWELPQDCGLTEDIFVDYGHFSREGALAFTDRLFDELTKQLEVAKRVD